jgi:hypothetical protein
MRPPMQPSNQVSDQPTTRSNTIDQQRDGTKQRDQAVILDWRWTMRLIDQRCNRSTGTMSADATTGTTSADITTGTTSANAMTGTRADAMTGTRPTDDAIDAIDQGAAIL